MVYRKEKEKKSGRRVEGSIVLEHCLGLLPFHFQESKSLQKPSDTLA